MSTSVNYSYFALLKDAQLSRMRTNCKLTNFANEDGTDDALCTSSRLPPSLKPSS